MKLSELYSKNTQCPKKPAKNPIISIEIFPPKADAQKDAGGAENLAGKSP